MYTREHGEDSLEVATAYLRLGALYTECNRFEDAEKALRKSLEIRQSKLGPNHSRVAQSLKHLLTLYELQGMDRPVRS